MSDKQIATMIAEYEKYSEKIGELNLQEWESTEKRKKEALKHFWKDLQEVIDFKHKIP